MYVIFLYKFNCLNYKFLRMKKNWGKNYELTEFKSVNKII